MALALILSQFCRQIVPRVDLVHLVPSPLIHCSRCRSCVGISSDGTYTSRFLPHSAREKTEKKANTVVLQKLPLSLEMLAALQVQQQSHYTGLNRLSSADKLIFLGDYSFLGLMDPVRGRKWLLPS